MSNEGVSETALITASLRALSNYEEDELINCKDEFAELVLPTDRQCALSTFESRQRIKQQIPLGLYEYVIARTKYFDSVFINALKSGFEQIVFLGAGFDSRSYRFREFILNTSIFEMDSKSTQNYKLECLSKNKFDVHPNISFIPINFESESIISTLCQYGYDTGIKTLFIWEGVTFYLSQNAVENIFKEIRINSGWQSQIGFDFQTAEQNDDLIKTGLQTETIKFGIKEDRIFQFVENHKYRVIEHVNALEIEKRFLVLANGNKFGTISPKMNFLLIEHN